MEEQKALLNEVAAEGYDAADRPFDFVEEAVASGIIKGFADGTFCPFNCITRVQLALMLVRAGGCALYRPPSGYVMPLQDVPGYAAEAVAIAYYNDLLSGETATAFDPYGLATRGQVAKMIYNLMERLRG